MHPIGAASGIYLDAQTMNIVFTGMRGTGKSTLGRALADHLKWPFVDVDKEIERRLNKKIIHLIEKEGWSAFRALERTMAQELTMRDRTVISTGGGMLIDPTCCKLLKENAHVVLLVCNLDQLKICLASSYKRPSLTGKASAIEEIEKVWEERKERYHALADTIHDTTDWPPLEILLEKLKRVPDLNL